MYTLDLHAVPLMLGIEGETCSVLLVESARPVQAEIMAGRAEVKTDMVSAVLAVVAAANDRADPAAVAAHPIHPSQQ